MHQPLPVPPTAQRLADLTKLHRLGGAYIHAFGIGHLQSVVNVGDDPNNRGNPRPLNSSHVDNLLAVFSVPGSKRDHESPIFLMISPEHVSPELLATMSKADPRDPAAEMPPLVLQHPHSNEVLELESQLMAQIKDKRWMSPAELQAATTRLGAVRAQIPLATILNGHHRIRALIQLGAQIQRDYDHLVAQVREGTIGSNDMRQAMEAIQERAKMTMYRVEVFDSESHPFPPFQT
jgi:hypothetical protein